jgi:multiple sugar transport system substrate-binding protein
LLAAAQKLTTGGQYGIGLPANHNLFTDQTTYDIMINQGAEEIYNTDGTLNFDNPKTVAAFDYYKQLYQYSPPDSSNWAWGEAEACLVSSTCAMILQFAVITTFDKAGGIRNLGVSAIPAATGVTSGTAAYPCGIMVLTSDPAKKDASYKFLRFLFDPKNYGPFVTAEAGLYLPVTQDTAQNAGFWSDPLITKYNSQLQVMVKNSENGMLFGFLPAMSTSVEDIFAEYTFLGITENIIREYVCS